MKDNKDNMRKRCERLTQKGYRYLDDDKYDKALVIAKKLRAFRYTAAFEIAALAYHGQGKLKRAITVLEKGVALAPEASWINWQLLGNYRSDLGQYSAAAAAYKQALKCPLVNRSSVLLNQAILANRKGEHIQALSCLDEIDSDDNRLKLKASTVKIESLLELDKLYEAECLAIQIMRKLTRSGEIGTMDVEFFGSLAADLCRIRMRQGKDFKIIRTTARKYLRKAPGYEQLLRVIREIDNQRSKTSKYYNILVHAININKTNNNSEAKGFFSSYHVIANTPEEGLEFIKRIDDPLVAKGFTIEEYKNIGSSPGKLKGVYWCTGRSYYDES